MTSPFAAHQLATKRSFWHATITFKENSCLWLSLDVIPHVEFVVDPATCKAPNNMFHWHQNLQLVSYRKKIPLISSNYFLELLRVCAHLASVGTQKLVTKKSVFDGLTWKTIRLPVVVHCLLYISGLDEYDFPSLASVACSVCSLVSYP